MTRLWVSKLNLLTAAAVPLAPPVALITNGNTSNGLQEHVIDANAEKISSNIIIKALGMVYALCMCNFFQLNYLFPKIFISNKNQLSAMDGDRPLKIYIIFND